MYNDLPEIDAEIRAVCDVLEAVAKGFPEGSAEASAVEEAAHAYVCVKLHLNLRGAYEACRRSLGEELPEAMKQTLRDMGIDVDDPAYDVDAQEKKGGLRTYMPPEASRSRHPGDLSA